MSRRILLLITDLEIGGTPSVVRELAVRLNSPDARMDVACLGGWGPVAQQIKAAGVQVTALGARGPWDVGVIWKLHRLIAAGEYDTLISFLIHANTAAVVMKMIHPKLRCIQSIQTTQPEPGWHWGLQGYVQRWADVVLAPSQSVARAAEVGAATMAASANAQTKWRTLKNFSDGVTHWVKVFISFHSPVCSNVHEAHRSGRLVR